MYCPPVTINNRGSTKGYMYIYFYCSAILMGAVLKVYRGVGIHSLGFRVCGVVRGELASEINEGYRVTVDIQDPA